MLTARKSPLSMHIPQEPPSSLLDSRVPPVSRNAPLGRSALARSHPSSFPPACCRLPPLALLPPAASLPLLPQAPGPMRTEPLPSCGSCAVGFGNGTASEEDTPPKLLPTDMSSISPWAGPKPATSLSRHGSSADHGRRSLARNMHVCMFTRYTGAVKVKQW